MGEHRRIVADTERAAHSLGVILERSLSGTGLMQAEIHVLGHLTERGSSTIAALHGSFGHKRSTLTSILDRLEVRGLVRRDTDPRNRRSVVVTLTNEGSRMARRVGKVLARLEDRLSSSVTLRDLQGYRAVIAAIDQEGELS